MSFRHFISFLIIFTNIQISILTNTSPPLLYNKTFLQERPPSTFNESISRKLKKPDDLQLDWPIGGVLCDIYAFPYYVRLEQKARYVAEKIVCGGSILSPSTILTSASCCSNKLKGIVKFLPSFDPQTRHISSKGSVMIASWDIHPKYEEATNSFDLCIITLNGTLQIKPGDTVSLGAGDFYNHVNLTSDSSVEEVQVYGMDASGEKRGFLCMEMVISPNGVCVGSHFNSNSMFCSVRWGNESMALGKGDIGGPVIYRRKQIGIVSYSDRNRTLFTKVDHIFEWILGLKSGGCEIDVGLLVWFSTVILVN